VSEAVGVGLAGCGRVAERGYLPALRRSTSLRLVGVADPDADRRARLARAVPGFADVAALLSSVEVELLVVATPPDTHHAVAAAASAVGVPSLVEKPPAGDALGAAALAALRPSPWIGLNRRFDPDVARLREAAIAMQATEVEVDLTIDAAGWDAFAGSPTALVDLGPHAADLACWTTGRAPRRVLSRASGARSSSFVLELEGAEAHIRVSHAGGWREEVRVGAGRRTARLRRGGLLERVRRRVRGPGPLVDSLRAQLEAVGRAVRGEPADPRLASAADGVRVMAVLDAVARAERRPGTWVPVQT
jgi:predicted dehydrogenase